MAKYICVLILITHLLNAEKGAFALWLEKVRQHIDYKLGKLPKGTVMLQPDMDQIDSDLIGWANKAKAEVAVWEAYDKDGKLLFAYGEEGHLFGVAAWDKYKKLVERMEKEGVSKEDVASFRFRHVHPVGSAAFFLPSPKKPQKEFSYADNRIAFEARAVLNVMGFNHADFEMHLIYPGKGDKTLKTGYRLPKTLCWENGECPMSLGLRKVFEKINTGEKTIESLFPKAPVYISAPHATTFKLINKWIPGASFRKELRVIKPENGLPGPCEKLMINFGQN